MESVKAEGTQELETTAVGFAEREALRKCRDQICDDLQLVEVLTKLEAQGITKKLDRQMINKEGTEFERNGKLVDILMARGTAGFNAFILALRDTCQPHIANSLMQARNS